MSLGRRSEGKRSHKTHEQPPSPKTRKQRQARDVRQEPPTAKKAISGRASFQKSRVTWSCLNGQSRKVSYIPAISRVREKRCLPNTANTSMFEPEDPAPQKIKKKARTSFVDGEKCRQRQRKRRTYRGIWSCAVKWAAHPHNANVQRVLEISSISLFASATLYQNEKKIAMTRSDSAVNTDNFACLEASGCS